MDLKGLYDAFFLPTLHRDDKNQLNITRLNWKPVYQH